MTDVPVLVRVGVVAPMGNSDHSSLLAVISMAQAVPNMCVSRRVYLKHEVNYNTVCGAVQDQPTWRNICLADNLLDVLNELLSLLVGRYVQAKVIFVRNKNKPWFDDRMQACFWPQAVGSSLVDPLSLRINWEEFVRCQASANETFS